MSKEDMIIKIITEEAKEIDANIISLFQITETGNKYAIYTFNEEDAQGLVKIYASKLLLNDNLYILSSISDTDEWTKVKEMMKDMAKESSSYIKDGIVVLINAKEIKSNINEPLAVKISETKAAKIGPSYKNGIANNYSANVPSFVGKIEEPIISTPVVETPVVEIPEVVVTPDPVVEEVSTPAQEVSPFPEALNIEIPKVEEAPVMPEPIVSAPYVAPVFETETKVEEPTVSELPSMDDDIKIEEPKFEKFNPILYEKELPNVDSILNKASSSYYNGSEDEDEEDSDSKIKVIEKENIIQTIGLEFMQKVSELAEYEKDLKRRDKEIEMRERGLIKIEREILTRDAKAKETIRIVRDKELDFKRREKEIAEKEADLNRKVLEFNKKITMFQQSFGMINND